MISNIILSPFSSITFSQATHVIITLLWTIGSFSSPTMRCLLLFGFYSSAWATKKNKTNLLCPISDDIIEQNKKFFLTLILSIWVVNIVQSDCSQSPSTQSQCKSFHFWALDQSGSTAARAGADRSFLAPQTQIFGAPSSRKAGKSQSICVFKSLSV